MRRIVGIYCGKLCAEVQTEVQIEVQTEVQDKINLMNEVGKERAHKQKRLPRYITEVAIFSIFVNGQA